MVEGERRKLACTIIKVFEKSEMKRLPLEVCTRLDCDLSM